jgi:hypothetical protein
MDPTKHANVPKLQRSGWTMARLFTVAGRVSVFCLLTSALVGTQALGETTNIGPKTSALRISHFAGILSVPTSKGTEHKLQLEIDGWQCSERDTEIDIPANSVTIMTVAVGKIRSLLGGKTQIHSTGDYWVVPAGAHMVVSAVTRHGRAVVRTIVTAPLS